MIWNSLQDESNIEKICKPNLQMRDWVDLSISWVCGNDGDVGVDGVDCDCWQPDAVSDECKMKTSKTVKSKTPASMRLWENVK